MRLKEYLTEAKLPQKQLEYFKDLRSEFLAGNRGYKFTTVERFMKDLEKDDYKSLSVLFGDLGITSIAGFISKYKDEIISINEAIDWNKGSIEDIWDELPFNTKCSLLRTHCGLGNPSQLAKMTFSKLDPLIQKKLIKGVKSQNEDIDWNKDWSSPEKKAIKTKFSKVLSIISAKAQHGKTEYVVELIGGNTWPKEYDIIKFCDADASFGGKVVDSADNKKQKYVTINNS